MGNGYHRVKKPLEIDDVSRDRVSRVGGESRIHHETRRVVTQASYNEIIYNIGNTGEYLQSEDLKTFDYRIQVTSYIEEIRKVRQKRW